MRVVSRKQESRRSAPCGKASGPSRVRNQLLGIVTTIATGGNGYEESCALAVHAQQDFTFRFTCQAIEVRGVSDRLPANRLDYISLLQSLCRMAACVNI